MIFRSSFRPTKRTTDLVCSARPVALKNASITFLATRALSPGIPHHRWNRLAARKAAQPKLVQVSLYEMFNIEVQEPVKVASTPQQRHARFRRAMRELRERRAFERSHQFSLFEMADRSSSHSDPYRAPVPAIRAVHRQREHRASATSPRAASSSGASRSGPSSEAGPSSAGGDDPDGPPPHVISARANAPTTTFDGDLVHALGVDTAVAVAVAVAATAAVAEHPIHSAGKPGVLNPETPRKPKEESMFNKVTNYLAVALIAVVFMLSFPVTVRAQEGGSHEVVPVSIPPNPMPEATPMKVPLSRFTSIEPERLTKSFELVNGELVTKPGGHMVEGQVERVEVEFPSGFAELLTQLTINMACGYGVPNVDEAHVTTRENAGSGDLARIREHFHYLAAAMVLMLDYDVVPGTVPLTREALVSLLTWVCPEIADCALVTTDSASSHIVDAKTGEELKGEGGKRVYLLAKNGKDIPRAGQVLFDRLVLAGHGHIQITKAGTMLVRTLIDGSVWQPERLDFAAGAHCGQGLVQLRPAPTCRDGGALDTVAALPPLTQEEERRLAQITAALKAGSQDEAAAVRAAWAEERVVDHERRAGRTLTAEERQALRDRFRTAAATYTLPDDFVLHGKAGEVTVGEVLADPAKWNGATFADPLEPDYHGGELLAKFIVKPGRQPYIRSFAHGGIAYSFTSTPPSPPAPPAAAPSTSASPTAMSPTATAPSTTTAPPSEQDLLDRFLAIPTNTSTDKLPAALAPLVSELRRANPITASKVVKEAARHLGIGATLLRKQIRIIEKELDGDEEELDEPEELIIARGVNAITRGELACIEPPAKPSITPVFHRVQPEGHLLLMRPEELHDLFNMVAGRPLEPAEYTLVAWYLATAVLEFRGGEILQRGILCKNGYISFDLDNWFIPGRPKQPAVFYVPKTFIEDPAALPPLNSLKTIQAWEKWGVNIVALLELIARVLLTQQTGICYVFWGPGGEGKSTFLKYVTALVGQANVLPAEISDFSGERRLRGIASMRGKLLAVFDDAPHNVFDILGTFFKEACTADTLTGAAVYQESVAFPNTSLIVVLSNHPSIGKDRTRGSADRRNIHVWSHRIRFTTENQENVERAWIQDEDEMDVIFSTAVHLARRYLETGRWQFMQPVEEAVYIAEALTTVEARFLWERFEQAEDHYLSWDDIDTAYNKWWPDPDHRDPFSHDRFFTAMEVTWGGARCRRQEENYRTRGVTGIRLLPKEKPTFTPKPGVSELGLGMSQVASGQKKPRIEGGPSSGEEKNLEEGEEEEIFQEPGRDVAAGVVFSGHLSIQEALKGAVEDALHDVDLIRYARDSILARARLEGGLHQNRAAALLPEHLQPMLPTILDALVAEGHVRLDGIWIHAVSPGEVQ